MKIRHCFKLYYLVNIMSNLQSSVLQVLVDESFTIILAATQDGLCLVGPYNPN